MTNSELILKLIEMLLIERDENNQLLGNRSLQGIARNRAAVTGLFSLLPAWFSGILLRLFFKECIMANPTVLLETTSGDILIELYADKAPATVENFLKYVNEGFYANTIFHRVIKGFMIQGGGMNMKMEEKATHAPIKNEADNGLANERGTIAMARTNDPDSATAQFFINVANNDFLNHKNETPSGYGYAVFGKVIQGQDVVDRIKSVSTGSYGPYQDVPKTPVIIKSIVPVQ